MRYILYLFTLALVFVAGMLVGNFYLPARNAALAAAISVPGATQTNDAVQQCTLTQTERNLDIIGQALTACPVAVNEEKDRLINQIRLWMARQDFEIKKARYELEIAKNIKGTRTTADFAKASSEYSAAGARLAELADAYFPPVQAEPTAAADTNEPSAAQTKIPDEKPGTETK